MRQLRVEGPRARHLDVLHRLIVRKFDASVRFRVDAKG